ncbi:STAS domain-containing protein [Actinomadura opuntiae]|uniref:STAS domain-containing protein n=1 Tax=Actinomadura sp. OS1-43 TaxID=604315 RepID=UPI00255B3BAE|nr:STAS domain-containing protein [Actinomadura sp. OS1-43]MDL4815404.1 STAS domain-containing protein [Actinomadura sp. OS1-43]
MEMVADRRARKAVFSVDRCGEWSQVTVTGELDLTTAATFKDHLTQAMAGRAEPRVSVDVSRMRFCDSSALNEFLRARKRISALRGRLVLLNPTDRFTRILRTMGLDRVFEIREALPA